MTWQYDHKQQQGNTKDAQLPQEQAVWPERGLELLHKDE